MTKEEIMNTYAIEQGHESWEHLIINIIHYYGYKDATNHIATLFNNVTDLIQEELKKKINKEYFENERKDWYDLTKLKQDKSILNTEIL